MNNNSIFKFHKLGILDFLKEIIEKYNIDLVLFGDKFTVDNLIDGLRDFLDNILDKIETDKQFLAKSIGKLLILIIRENINDQLEPQIKFQLEKKIKINMTLKPFIKLKEIKSILDILDEKVCSEYLSADYTESYLLSKEITLQKQKFNKLLAKDIKEQYQKIKNMNEQNQIMKSLDPNIKSISSKESLLSNVKEQDSTSSNLYFSTNSQEQINEEQKINNTFFDQSK